MKTELSERSRGASNYRNAIRASVRGLWVGAMDYDQAYDSLWLAVEQGLTLAVHEGISECGIKPSEMSPQEKDMLREVIFNERSYIDRFLIDIEKNSKKNGGKLGPLMSRADLWVNRYKDITNRAKTMACGDKKLMWILGKTEEHCSSCLGKLNGKVKRASQWERADIRPQHPDLECGGWRCDCSLESTDAPMSRGPLPRIP